MFKIIKKADIILVIILVLLGLSLSFLFASNDTKGEKVVITMDGKEYGTYNIYENKIIHIKVGNTVEIKDGYVQMLDSTCPGKDCLSQRKIKDGSMAIVCLPHKLIIEIEGGNSSYDAVSG